MIHNMTEERKKLNRYDVPLPAPLTEEELMRLIETVEERELLHAPGHLRGNIFSHIQEGKRKERQRALFSYRAKVLVGMAAALAVLILVPADRTGTAGAPQTSMFGWLYGEAEETDDWEQELLERQREIAATWERYQKGQERANARKQYIESITSKLTDYEKWED